MTLELAEVLSMEQVKLTYEVHTGSRSLIVSDRQLDETSQENRSSLVSPESEPGFGPDPHLSLRDAMLHKIDSIE